MTGGRVVVLEISRLEAAHLADLVRQFADLLDETGDGLPDDPAVGRLVPDAYADDAVASREFRALTQRELIGRRTADATSVLESLHGATAPHGPEEDPDPQEVAVIRLDSEALQAWLRTLAAVRLVLASRLGIKDEEDHDDDDPRFGIYDWLGYRLDGLVRAADAGL